LAANASKNFDTLSDGLTNVLHKSGSQPGFVVVLEHIPAHAKFDKEAREQLLDIFREAADYWSDRKIAFRCFYSFSVARAPASEKDVAPEGIDLLEDGEKMPTDKLVDVSPLALRMSSPFNAGYGLFAWGRQCIYVTSFKDFAPVVRNQPQAPLRRVAGHQTGRQSCGLLATYPRCGAVACGAG
jgi:hypothetical protein